LLIILLSEVLVVLVLIVGTKRQTSRKTAAENRGRFFDYDSIGGEEKTLFAWKALERPHKQWGKELFSTVVVLAILVSIILFFIEGIMPVLVVWAAVFMMWVSYKIKPGLTKHKITSWGVRTGDNLYRWEAMRVFWFEEKWGIVLLRIILNRRLGQLILVCNKEEKGKIKDILKNHMPLERPRPSAVDKMVKWFGEKLPLEEEIKV